MHVKYLGVSDPAAPGGVLSGAVVFPQVPALKAEQARVQAERPAGRPGR